MSGAAVTVVIPVWNGRDLLLRLLKKLEAQTYPIAEVLAVDKGIEACHTDLVALVNSDVEPEPEWLARLVTALQAPEVWFATGKILSTIDRDRIDGTYDLISRAACAWRKGQGRPDGPEYSQSREISMAPATAALFRTELFHRAGRFDEAFESYLEDVDFGLRCALGGFKGRYVADAIAYHQGSASLGKWNP